jgi:hypothetical protein
LKKNIPNFTPPKNTVITTCFSNLFREAYLDFWFFVLQMAVGLGARHNIISLS